MGCSFTTLLSGCPIGEASLLALAIEAVRSRAETLSRGAVGAERSELALDCVAGAWHSGILSSANDHHPNARRANNIFSAKEIGEPPLVLANSVFFAIKAAIRASRLERGLPGLFRFDAPATVQEVRRACEVSASE
jgi:hypothetical protein